MVPGCAWWFWDVYIGSLQLRANSSCLLCAAGAPLTVYLYLVVYSVLQSAPGQCLARSRPAINRYELRIKCRHTKCYGSPPSGPSSRPPRNRLRHRAASDIRAARHPSARDRSVGREFPTERPQVHLRSDRTRTMGSLIGHMTAGKWPVRRPH